MILFRTDDNSKNGGFIMHADFMPNVQRKQQNEGFDQIPQRNGLF